MRAFVRAIRVALKQFIHFSVAAEGLGVELQWATFLEEEERKWYFLWLAWVIDLGSFAACVIIYAIISILVFVLSR